MRTRRTWIFLFITLCACIIAAAWQAPAPRVEDQFFQFVANEGRFASVNRGKRPAGPAAALVQTLGGQAKAYSASELFRKRWTEYRAQHLPQAPAKMATLAELKAKQQADSAHTDRELQEQIKNIKNLPPEVQAQVKASLEEARKASKQMPQLSEAQLVEMEKARYEDEKQDYERRMAEAPPADPKVAIRRALQAALAATGDIDFAATTRREGGWLRFTDPDYEQKSYEWKMGYRAGREATAAARAFAQSWLAELK